jgi:HD-GYP domain-containing protein (c-di-GMP phosphodiesterase class II)
VENQAASSRFSCAPDELLCIGLGVVAVSAALVLVFHGTPSIPPLAILCVLSAAAMRFNVEAEDGSTIGAGAQGMVIAAAVVAFRHSSPLFGPLVVGMAGAFWRIPKSRHQWFAVPGNFGMFGLSAVAAASVLALASLGPRPAVVALAGLALPFSLTYAVANGCLMAVYVVLYERVAFKSVLAELKPHLLGAYLPFLFGAFVGELSLRYGLVVFALAAVALVMVQAVFASYRSLIESEREALEGMVAAVGNKDNYTARHSKRVVKFARYMGEHLGMKGRDLARLEQHALMHDIGKIAVPNHVLRKPGKLDTDERELMLVHEPAGAAILSAVPFLQLSAEIAGGHSHKDGFDGPVRASHIVHAADSFDAMTTTRPYRKAHKQEDAFAELRAKVGKDFHPECVEALIAAIEERGEVYGDGYEEEIVQYETPPPAAPLGSTLDDEAKADAVAGRKAEPLPPLEIEPRAQPPRSNDPIKIAVLTSVAFAAALIAATLGAANAIAAPVALGALVALGEVVCLRPIGRAPRPLALVVALVALRATSLPVAIATIVVGTLVGALLREKRVAHTADRLVVALVATMSFAIFDRVGPGTHDVWRTLVTLIATTTIAVVVQEAIAMHGRVDLDVHNRLADIALLACAPLVALGVAGTDTVHGLGLGALPVLVVPLALLTHGYLRMQRAHENMFAWMRAVSLAPEYARLVKPGRAPRVAQYALQLAEDMGLDAATREQLEAAAWMERVGECSLDVTGADPEVRRRDIVNASAEMLESSAAFAPAAEILRQTIDDNDDGSPVARAAHALRVAIAYEDAAPERVANDPLIQVIATRSDAA